MTPPHHEHEHEHEHADEATPHGHHHHTANASTRTLIAALSITLAYSVAEVLGGLWTGSLSLLADAVHMVSDGGALGIALVASIIARLPADARRTMGYRRVEVLAALLNATALLLLAAGLVREAIERFGSPPSLLGGPMLLIAGLGLLVNLILAWLLSRSHGPDVNLKAALYHVLGDALGSVGAMIAGLLALWKGWWIADPIATFAIAAIIVVGALRMISGLVGVLMQSAPPELDVARIRRAILAEPGVAGIHQLHVWCLSPGANVLTVHVVVAPDQDPIELTTRVRVLLLGMAALKHATVQAERPDGACPEGEPPDTKRG